MRAWALAVLVAIPLTGCAEEPLEELFSSGQALAAAERYLDGRYDGAILTSITTYGGELPASTVGWLKDRGMSSDVRPSHLFDGRSVFWILHFALPGDPGATPDIVVLQVMADDIREHFYPGATLAGEPPSGLDPEDICFSASGSARASDLDVLHDVADSTEVMATLRQDSRLAAFMPDVESIRLALDGARTSYGVLSEYWCWEREQRWTFIATDKQERSFRGVFTMQGSHLTTLDWRNGTARLAMDEVHHFEDGLLAPGQDFEHEMDFDVYPDAAWLHVSLHGRPARGSEDRAFQLTSPSGVAVDAWTGGAFKVDYPEAGTWTATYSYRATLPLGEHEMSLSVSWYGAA